MDLYVAHSEASANGESWVFMAYATSAKEAEEKILNRIRKDYAANNRFLASVDYFLKWQVPRKVGIDQDGVGVLLSPESP